MNSTRQPSTRLTLGKQWGQLLRTRRTSLGASQSFIAERAGVTQQAIAKFEAGLQIPLDRTKIDLAFALATTPDELFPWPKMPELLEMTSGAK